MDDFKLSYPLYLIAVEAGYHALQSTNAEGQPQLSAAVFRTEALAESYMIEMELEGSIRSLASALEFWQFLQALKPPTFDVVFDLHAVPEGHLEGDTRSIADLLEEHLPTVYAWRFPVFLLRAENQHFSITGSASGRGTVRLLCVFTDQDLAERYGKAMGVEAEPVKIATAGELATIMQSGTEDGIVLDARGDGLGTQKLCVDKATLLNKYLRT